MSEYKSKQVFSEPLQADLNTNIELNAQQQFATTDKFVPINIDASAENEQSETDSEQQLDKIIRPKKGRKWLAAGLLTSFAALVGWQAVDSVVQAVQSADWLALGWAGFISAIAALGLGAIGKELWKLRRLRNHFSIQEASEALLQSDSVGQGKAFCEKLAHDSGVKPETPSYDRWLNGVNPSHSDAEILDMYDAIVVAEQDKRATAIVTRHATESAALVAISPLAAADMLLVAWRNFKMIDNLADVYGIELGYWSRLQLFKSTLVNMAAAGASELAIDAGMDLMSMDLAGKLSARAGQGIGVGILTARLGLKAMSLLRPMPWHAERAVKLSAIRKQIALKVAELTVK
ncbi:YcjF family protein [Vibrio rhodolitus]|uniref:YcjF family protein n=1 Tax=Vibrio rhodolitus TaxID=2231649 RepID=UPI000E0BE7E6|nr:TIGR01620 family protein [Vibrio rhodolitus]